MQTATVERFAHPSPQSVFDPTALVDEEVAWCCAMGMADGVSLKSVVRWDMPRRVSGRPEALRAQLAALLAHVVERPEPGVVLIVLGAMSERDALRVEVFDTRLATERALPESLVGLVQARPLTGLGMAYTLQLELSPGSAKATSVSSVSSAPRAARPMHVLLAEDDPVSVFLMQRLCRLAGCTMEAVEDGAAAVLAFAARPYDLVILDCTIPVLDGTEAARLMRIIAHDTHVPIIAVSASVGSGSGSRAFAERCLAAGMDECLPKLIERGELKNLLERWS